MKGDFRPPAKDAPTLKDTFQKPSIHKLTLNIDPDIHQDLKIQAAKEGRTMREVIEDLVTGYLTK